VCTERNSQRHKKRFVSSHVQLVEREKVALDRAPHTDALLENSDECCALRTETRPKNSFVTRFCARNYGCERVSTLASGHVLRCRNVRHVQRRRLRCAGQPDGLRGNRLESHNGKLVAADGHVDSAAEQSAAFEPTAVESSAE